LKLKAPEVTGLLEKSSSIRVLTGVFSSLCFGKIGISRAEAKSAYSVGKVKTKLPFSSSATFTFSRFRL
jgi:hypothetical protein